MTVSVAYLTGKCRFWSNSNQH